MRRGGGVSRGGQGRRRISRYPTGPVTVKVYTRILKQVISA